MSRSKEPMVLVRKFSLTDVVAAVRALSPIGDGPVDTDDAIKAIMNVVLGCDLQVHASALDAFIMLDDQPGFDRVSAAKKWLSEAAKDALGDTGVAELEGKHTVLHDTHVLITTIAVLPPIISRPLSAAELASF